MATTIEKLGSCTPNNGVVKGRRKLDFTESQRFKGKHFFLDLNGYRKTKSLTAELTARGATVQNYLDKNVRYLITNQSHNAIDKAKTNISSNPTGGTPSTGGLSQVFSPYSAGQPSPHLVDKKPLPQPYYFTRSQKILQMSKDKDVQSGKMDVLTMAARWNCKIIHVEAVEKELKKLKPLTTKNVIEYKKPDPKYVRKLRKPFLKIEDRSRQYRPIIYEPVIWPSLNLNCPIKASPFDVKHPKHTPIDSGEDHNSDVERDGVDEEEDEECLCEDEKRPGFCEPCSVRYEDLKSHLLSASHEEYANNEKNFAKLDELIAQCTSLQDFIAETKRLSKSNITPDRVMSPAPRSPMIREAQLSLKKIASPVSLTRLPNNRKRVGGSPSESLDQISKRTKLNL